MARHAVGARIRPIPPQLSEPLDGQPIDLADDVEWADVRISGDFSGISAARVEVSGSHLVGAKLTGAQLEQIRLSDCLLEDCELSGVIAPKLTATRVEFRGCRMSGIVAPESKWENVGMSECKLDTSSFRMSAWHRCELDDCTLTEADFYGGQIRDSRFVGSDLTRVDFAKAAIEALYLHGSSLDGLRGGESLKGVVIGSDQVIPLSLALFSSFDIRVDDEPD